MAMTLTLCRALASAAIAAASVAAAHAQPSPNCGRLEAQLASFDRSVADSGRGEQARRYEEAIGKQQAEIDQQQALARRTGCGNNSFFVLFSGEPAACGPLNARIQQMRANLDTMQADLARIQGGGVNAERDSQRRAILGALAQNNCGQQYNAAVAAATPQPRGSLFESLFGRNETVISPGGSAPNWSVPSGSYRTICVRTCDGFYYPISFAADSSRFAEDEKVCRRSCPAAEVMLFAHRNPGEDVSQAVSIGGQLYSTLPNAFKYRQAFDNGCSCRQPGESWAKALRGVDDGTVERGDIVVNEDRARQLSTPRIDAQGKPIAPPPRPPARPASQPNPPTAKTAEPSADAAKPDEPATKPDPNRAVRAVGPTFLPGR
jgi:uncharacterized protein DUF2865